jgi:hypothetical protein
MKKQKKVKTLAQIKKIADAKTSLYVRQKDADFNGYVACFTCYKKKKWQELQCGHFVSRVYLIVRWYIPNLRPQCYSCNIEKNGNLEEYAAHLERETPGIVVKLNQLKHISGQSPTYLDILDIIKDMENKLKQL